MNSKYKLPYIDGHMKQKVGHCRMDQQRGMQYAPETQNFEKSVCIFVPSTRT